MEPLERSVSHGTDTESVDTMATNQSIGPALVGNISVDSLDDHNHNTYTQLQHQEEQTQKDLSPLEPEIEAKQESDAGEKLEPVTQQTEEDLAQGFEGYELKLEAQNKSVQQPPDEEMSINIGINEDALQGQRQHLSEGKQPQQQQQQQHQQQQHQQQLELESLVDLEQGPDEDKELEQEQQVQQQPQFLDQSSRMSISDISEVQVQETKRESEEEKAKEEEHQPQRREDEKEEKVEVEEQKVELIEDDLNQEEPQEQENEDLKQQQAHDEGHEQHQQEPSDTSISLIKLHDTSSNELFHHTFKTAANTSRSPQQFGDEFEEDKNSIMEFAKGYSDELISNELHRATSGEGNMETGSSGGQNLADFELPPYSGSSSSGNDQPDTATKHSPSKQRKSSSTMAERATSSFQGQSGGVAPDLSAVKNVLVSSYSKVSHIFLWKRPIETGLIFGSGLTLIIALTFFSIISVVAYSALGVISASGLIRIYKTGMKALSRSSETPVDHIWNKALSLDVSLSSGKLHELADTLHANLNTSLVYFKQVLLFENKIATIKFFLFLYSLTYIGAWFNGLTLITLIYLALFSMPLLYEKNKTKIDEYVNLATKQVTSSISMVTDRVSSLLGSQAGGGSKKKD